MYGDEFDNFEFLYNAPLSLSNPLVATNIHGTPRSTPPSSSTFSPRSSIHRQQSSEDPVIKGFISYLVNSLFHHLPPQETIESKLTLLGSKFIYPYFLSYGLCYVWFGLW